jgi:hypothetical protein
MYQSRNPLILVKLVNNVCLSNETAPQWREVTIESSQSRENFSFYCLLAIITSTHFEKIVT